MVGFVVWVFDIGVRVVGLLCRLGFGCLVSLLFVDCYVVMDCYGAFRLCGCLCFW